jgi:cytochrome c oxidase subunit 4
MSTGRDSRPSSFATEARGLALAWLALLTLMMLSLGSAYLRLGSGNIVASLLIASIKTAIVAWWFMHLRVESATLRTTALVALFMLALLSSLSGVDYSTRRADPAAVQAPQQIEPLLQKGRGAATRR